MVGIVFDMNVACISRSGGGGRARRFVWTDQVPSRTGLKYRAGNVRELRNVCERPSILMAGRVIEESNLPREISNRVPLQKPLFTLPPLGLELEQVEMDLIRQALRRTNGNRTRSARLLGISRDALNYRIRKYGISSDRER